MHPGQTVQTVECKEASQPRRWPVCVCAHAAAAARRCAFPVPAPLVVPAAHHVCIKFPGHQRTTSRYTTRGVVSGTGSADVSAHDAPLYACCASRTLPHTHQRTGIHTVGGRSEGVLSHRLARAPHHNLLALLPPENNPLRVIACETDPLPLVLYCPPPLLCWA
jgi:hypothetical protein